MAAGVAGKIEGDPVPLKNGDNASAKSKVASPVGNKLQAPVAQRLGYRADRLFQRGRVIEPAVSKKAFLVAMHTYAAAFNPDLFPERRKIRQKEILPGDGRCMNEMQKAYSGGAGEIDLAPDKLQKGFFIGFSFFPGQAI